MRKYIGWVIVSTLVVYLLSLQVPFFLFAATLLAWSVPLIMWQNFEKAACIQALFLITMGFIFLCIAAYKGVFFHWEHIFAINVPLLGMFVAVSFLGLTNTDAENNHLPTGKRAIFSTALGMHLLGAVINLSVLFVFGDRLQRNNALSKSQMIILVRSFCAAAWWSPFFIATGVALTYCPEMLLEKTLIPGIIMTVTAILFSVIEVACLRKEIFWGYPFRVESMAVPVFLAVMVLGLHFLWPDISILNIICIVAPVGAMFFMKPRPSQERVRAFITTKMPFVSSQFLLFLAAGVFSAGLKSLTYAYPALLNLSSTAFTPVSFSLVLGVMILVGIIGIHPVISISIAAPLLLPLNVDHSQLAFLFLTSWAIATACSPLSGVGLTLMSRYKASYRGIILLHPHYAIIMWALASFMNILFFS